MFSSLEFLKYFSRIAITVLSLWMVTPALAQDPLSVSISCGSCRMTIGGTITLTARINRSNASSYEYLWQYNDGTIASGLGKSTVTWTTPASWVDTEESPFEGTSMPITVEVYNSDGEYDREEVTVEIDPRRKPGTGNRPPTITALECKDHALNTIPCSLDIGPEHDLSFIKLCVEASDPDGWITGYSWSASSGSFVDQGSVCKDWHPPTRSTSARISVRVTDNKGLRSNYFYQNVTVNLQSLPDTSSAPPKVSVSCNPCSVKPGGIVSLTATATDDGSIEGYEWYSNVTGGVFVDENTGQPIYQPADLDQPSVSWRAPDFYGEFFVTVVVTDDIDQTSTDDVKITVLPPENRDPTVEASCYPSKNNAKQCTVEGDAATRKVRLSAAVNDPDHNPVTYKWTAQDGAGHFLTSPNDDDTIWLPPPGTGTYRLTVTVDDGNGGTASDSVVVTSHTSSLYSPPTANAGSDNEIDASRFFTSLIGSGRAEAPGPLSYLWTQIEGPKGTIRDHDRSVALFRMPEISGDTKFVFKLRVIDSVGLYGEDTVTLTVKNRAPVITRIWCETESKVVHPSCDFSPGEAMSIKWEHNDPDGDSIHFREHSLDTELPMERYNFFSHTAFILISDDAEPGEYESSVTVSDGYGGVSEPATVTVTVKRPDPLNPPTELSASNIVNTAVSLSWTAPENTAVTGYQILRAVSDAETDENDTFSVIVQNTGTRDTQYRVTGLRTQTSYKFKVKAHMKGGGLTPASDSVRVVTKAPDPDGTGPVRLSNSRPYTYHTLNTDTADYEDRFSFSVSGRKLLDFRVYRSKIPLEVVLEDRRGNVLTKGWDSAPTDNSYKQIKMILNSGAYTIRITAKSGQTDYMTHFKLSDPSLPNVSVSLLARALEDVNSTLDFTVSLDQAPNDTITVDYKTRDGNARAGLDYTATSGTLTFETGDSLERVISVPVLEDTDSEGMETMYLDLSNASGANIKHSTGRGIIGGIGFSVTNAQAPEEPGAMLNFIVSLSEEPTETVTVEYRTVNGTATAGSDYTAKSGTLTFAAGETEKVVSVTVLDDSDAEGDETMTLRLSNASGADIVDRIGIGTITVGTVGISVSDTTVQEAANATLDFTVTLDQLPDGTVTVEYTTVDGTATAINDYTAKSGTLTFSAGETEKTVSVEVTSDSVVEGDETMTLRLSNPSGAIITDDEGTGTITSDGIGISVSDAEVKEESGATLDFEVTLDKAPGEGVTVTVNYATSDGTATAGNDYFSKSGTLTFAAGEREKTVSVQVLNPPHHRPPNEPTETMTLTLSSPSSNAFLRDDTGTGTIFEKNGFKIKRPGPVVQEESGATLDFIVILDQAEDSEVTVQYATRDGTSFITEYDDAEAGSDYTATSGTLTFAASETEKTVSVPVLNDDINEPTEVMELQLSNPSTGLIIIDSSVRGTITDAIGISVSDAEVEEASGATLDFVISLGRMLGAGESVTVTYSTEGQGVHDDATAESSVDYKAASAAINFREGERKKTVSVSVKEDSTDEDTEIMFLKLGGTIPSNAPGFVITDNEGKGTITDRTGISAMGSTAFEQPDEFGSSSIVFTVSLDREASSTITVNYETLNNTAIAGSDYTATSGTLTFQAGETEKTVNVTVLDDNTAEGEESMFLRIYHPTGDSYIKDTYTRGIIREFGISVSDGEAKEGVDSVLGFTVTLDAAPGAGETFTVNYATADGTATAGSDYTAISGTFTFMEGEREETIYVPLLDDNTSEGDETLTLQVSPPAGSDIVAGTGTGTIKEAAISVSDATVQEGRGSSTLLFLVTLDAAPGAGETFTVSYQTADGTATAGSDYTATSGTLTFSEGETEKTISVPVLDDEIAEGEETMTLQVSPPANSDVVAGTGTGTIKEFAILLYDATVQEGPGATLDFLVRMFGGPTSVITVNYATVDGTATAGLDYTATSGTLTFQVGETDKTISVPVLDDDIDEGNEKLTLVLSNVPDNFYYNTGTGTITNTDLMPDALLARFGRTVGSQAVDVISSRMGERKGENHLIVGGQDLFPAGGNTRGANSSEAWERPPEGRTPAQAGTRQSDFHWDRFEAEKSQEITMEDIAQGASFSFSGQDETGESGWSFWGELLRTHFQGSEGNLQIEGEVTSGFLGADVTSGNVKAGLALSQSEGKGSFYNEAVEASPGHSQDGGSDEEDKGKVESSLTSVYPYVGHIWGEDHSVWGFLGYGEGDMTMTTQRGEVINTDISMRMGAVGAKTPLMSQRDEDPLNMTLETDGMYVQMRSEAAQGMRASKTEVTRLRATVDTSRDFELGEGLLTPSLQLGVRKDGGDAEEGFGVETGLGLGYRGEGGLSLEGSVRNLLVHEEKDYEEWGASLALRLDPGASGRGLSFSLLPTWGNSASNNRLWGAQGLNEFSNDQFESKGHHLKAEIGYGFNPFKRLLGIFTPYVGFSRGDESRSYRTGTRWSIAPNADLSLELSRIHGTTKESEDEALRLKGGIRW